MLKRRVLTRVPRRSPPHALAVPLDVTIAQEKSNWCWAACTQVIASRHQKAVTQCSLADMALKLGGSCCAGAASAACDSGLKASELTALLQTLSPGIREVPRALSQQELHDELSKRGPVAVGYSYGHLCLVYGMAGERFLFYDPRGPVPAPPASGQQSYSGIVTYLAPTRTPVWVCSWTGL